MGQQFKQLTDKHQAFIQAQCIFFVATAAREGSVNLSPKGMDSLRVLDARRVAWLNVTGSGNETAAHVAAHPRMTLMFAAFEGAPMILRIYGQATAVHPDDADWLELFSLFLPLPGARQIFDLRIERVQTSCGMAVPRFDHIDDRDELNRWAEKLGPDGIAAYQQKKNQRSIDGLPTR